MRAGKRGRGKGEYIIVGRCLSWRVKINLKDKYQLNQTSLPHNSLNNYSCRLVKLIFCWSPTHGWVWDEIEPKLIVGFRSVPAWSHYHLIIFNCAGLESAAFPPVVLPSAYRSDSEAGGGVEERVVWSRGRELGQSNNITALQTCNPAAQLFLWNL